MDIIISYHSNSLNALIHLNLSFFMVLKNIYHSHIRVKHHNLFLIQTLFIPYQIQLFISHLNNHHNMLINCNIHKFRNEYHSS